MHLGGQLAVPCGPTPVSRGDECRLVTRVSVLGRLEGDPQVLRQVANGDESHVEAAA